MTLSVCSIEVSERSSTTLVAKGSALPNSTKASAARPVKKGRNVPVRAKATTATAHEKKFMALRFYS